MTEKVTYIIRKGGEFLVAIAYTDSKTPRWSNSAWDAVRFTWYQDARRVADILGGEIIKFSNIHGVLG